MAVVASSGTMGFCGRKFWIGGPVPHGEWRYYSLNDVGTRAWELCDGSRTLSEIVDVLAGEYDQSEATIHEDVGTLFSELFDDQLLLNAQPAS